MSRLTAAHALLTRAVAEGISPGAQLAVRFPDGSIEHVCVGALSYEPGAPLVTPDTLYDLASITKPVTALAFVRAGIALDLTIDAVLPWTRDTAIRGATLEQLLSHRAGLIPWAPYYQTVEPERAGRPEARRLVLDAIAREPRAEPGLVRYSDLGYMLLGEALAVLTDANLDTVVHREVVAPLGLGMGYRGIGATWVSAAVAPTEQCPWRARVLQGEVHDENAYALGGVCGHAGLFGTARDVLGLGAAALDSLAGMTRWLAPERMAWMIAARPGGTHRLGWDARGEQSPASGTLMGPRTFGHLGFTGTSLWCDPDARIVIALVTNRVHPCRTNMGIRALRPAVHDAVMSCVVE